MNELTDREKEIRIEIQEYNNALYRKDREIAQLKSTLERNTEEIKHILTHLSEVCKGKRFIDNNMQEPTLELLSKWAITTYNKFLKFIGSPKWII